LAAPDASLRVLRVVLFIDNLGSGGAQRQAAELAVHLHAEREVDVRVVAYQDVNPSRDRSLHGERLARAGVPFAVVPKRGKLDPTYPVRLAAWLRRNRVDVIHAFMARPASWSLLAIRLLPRARRPILIGAERSALAASQGLVRTIQGAVYRRCDAVTVNSRPALEELANELGVARERLHYVPNGIDLDAWDRAAGRPAPWPLEEGRFHVALIGRFGAEKNHRLLLDALQRLGPRELASWRVWFVGASTGEPGTREALEKEIRDRELGEVVRAAAPTGDIAALMRSLDLLVLPSRYEGFPNVVLEAMSSRLLVAATPVGDVPSLVRDGETGISFASDADSLARALMRARSLSPAERDALVGNARREIETRYRIRHVGAEYVRLYRIATSRTPPEGC
jgi:glycosyltransferase involved in cell wall biosynthesis